MEQFYVQKVKDLEKNKRELEEKLNVKIKIEGKKVSIEGEALEEYDATLVFEAIEFGFSPKKALSLINEEVIFKVVHIKSHTNRNLKAVVARLVGTKGKTKRTISDIADCEILIKDTEVGIIGYVEDVANVEQAIINIIKGSKQANMYRYLERMNRTKKEYRT